MLHQKNNLNTVFLSAGGFLLLQGIMLRLVLCDAELLRELTHLVVPICLAGTAAFLLRKVDWCAFFVNHAWLSAGALYGLGLLTFLVEKYIQKPGDTVSCLGTIITVFASIPVLFAQRNRDVIGFAITMASLFPSLVLSWIFHSTIGIGVALIAGIILVCASCAKGWYNFKKSFDNRLVIITCVMVVFMLLFVPAVSVIQDGMLYHGWLDDWMHPEHDPLGDGFYAVSAHQIAKEASFFTGSNSVHRWNDTEVSMHSIFSNMGDTFLLLSALNAYGWWLILLWIAAVMTFLISGVLLCKKRNGILFHFAFTAMILLAAQFLLYFLHQFGFSPIHMTSVPFFSADGLGLLFSLLPLFLVACCHKNYFKKAGESSHDSGAFEAYFMDGMK